MTYIPHPRQCPKVIVYCKRCGTPTERKKHDVDYGVYQYCSNSCAHKALSVNEETALNDLFCERDKLSKEIQELEDELAIKTKRLKELTYQKLASKFDLSFGSIARMTQARKK